MEFVSQRIFISANESPSLVFLSQGHSQNCIVLQNGKLFYYFSSKLFIIGVHIGVLFQPCRISTMTQNGIKFIFSAKLCVKYEWSGSLERLSKDRRQLFRINVLTWRSEPTVQLCIVEIAGDRFCFVLFEVDTCLWQLRKSTKGVQAKGYCW